MNLGIFTYLQPAVPIQFQLFQPFMGSLARPSDAACALLENPEVSITLNAATATESVVLRRRWLLRGVGVDLGAKSSTAAVCAGSASAPLAEIPAVIVSFAPRMLRQPPIDRRMNNKGGIHFRNQHAVRGILE